MGREIELNEISKILTTAKTLALWGMTGNGKSILAENYARKNINNYYIIWKIIAENEINIISGLSSLARQLKIYCQNLNELINTLLAELNRLSKPVLIIFDNLANYDEIKKFIPLNENIKIILTSRSKVLNGTIENYEIQEFSIETSVKYLESLLKFDRNKENIRDLAIRLDGWPLALNQAAGIINEQEITIKEFIRIYKSMLAKDLIISATVKSIYERGNNSTKDVFTIISLCNSQQIPEDLIKSIIIKKYDEITWWKTNGQISASNIIRRVQIKHEKNTKIYWNVHRLVHSALQSNVHTEEIILIMKKYFVENFYCDYDNINNELQKFTVQNLTPHAEVLLNQEKLDTVDDIKIALNLVKSYYWTMFNEIKGSNLKNNIENSALFKNPEKIEDKNDLAYIYLEIGNIYVGFNSGTMEKVMIIKIDYVQAEEYYKKSISILLENPGINFMALIKNYLKIGLLCTMKGEFNESQIYLSKCLEILTTNPIEDQQYIARAYFSLFILHSSKMNFDEGEKYLSECLSILELILSKENLFWITSYQMILLQYINQKQFEKAEAVIEKMILFKQSYYPDNYSIEISIDMLKAFFSLSKGDINSPKLIFNALSKFGSMPSDNDNPTTLKYKEVYSEISKDPMSIFKNMPTLFSMLEERMPNHPIVNMLHNMLGMFDITNNNEADTELNVMDLLCQNISPDEEFNQNLKRQLEANSNVDYSSLIPGMMNVMQESPFFQLLNGNAENEFADGNEFPNIQDMIEKMYQVGKS